MKAKKLQIAFSPLTGRIYIGTPVKNGTTWGADQTDVTNHAVFAVCERVFRDGGKATCGSEGLKYEITVKEVE